MPSSTVPAEVGKEPLALTCALPTLPQFASAGCCGAAAHTADPLGKRRPREEFRAFCSPGIQLEALIRVKYLTGDIKTLLALLSSSPASCVMQFYFV